jgi:hypothetical protein
MQPTAHMSTGLPYLCASPRGMAARALRSQPRKPGSPALRQHDFWCTVPPRGHVVTDDSGLIGRLRARVRRLAGE